MDFKNNKGSVVGSMGDSKWYRTVRQKSKHLMIKGDAWAVDEAIVAQLRALEAKGIQLYDAEEKKFYVVRMDELMAHSYINDHGYGEQRFLPRRYWEIKTPQKNELETTPTRDKQPGEDGQARSTRYYAELWATIR